MTTASDAKALAAELAPVDVTTRGQVLEWDGPARTVRSGSGAHVLLVLDGPFMASLGRLPLLRAEDEVALAQAAEAGALAEEALAHPTGPRSPDAGATVEELEHLVSAGETAFQQLVLSNIRLAAWMARRRIAARATNLDYADLVHEGAMGLVRAAHKWDYRRGLKFSTYAAHWISAFQQRADLRADGIPLAVVEQRRAIARARAELTVELARDPDLPELVERVGLNGDRISQLESYRPRERFLDAPMSSASDQTWEAATRDHTMPDPADVAASRETTHDLLDAIDRLPRRYQTVLQEHFGLGGEEPQTVAAIARRHRVSADRAAATLQRGLQVLREQMGSADKVTH